MMITSLLSLILTLAAPGQAAPAPPGTVIAHSPASSGLYIGSPGLAVLPNGDYAASHDFFGPKSGEFESARTLIYGSSDRGKTWKQRATIQGAFWSSLFVHRGALYLLGTDRHHGDIVIRRSEDGGNTWTVPIDGSSGILQGDGEHHCAPTPVIEHDGRLWRGFEWRNPPVAWGINYRAGMISVPVDADLLDASKWTFCSFLPSSRGWNGNDMGAWLEGNAVVSPTGEVVDILRVQTRSMQEKAAILHVSRDGKTGAFDPERDFIDFPGGAKKFTIRFDAKSRTYWSLTNVVTGSSSRENPGAVRNRLSLISSKDLRHWQVRKELIYHQDQVKHGFQYVEWLFEGNDIIAAVRTAFDDEEGGAHNYHDANFLTFHRFRNFRSAAATKSKP